MVPIIGIVGIVRLVAYQFSLALGASRNVFFQARLSQLVQDTTDGIRKRTIATGRMVSFGQWIRLRKVLIVMASVPRWIMAWQFGETGRKSLIGLRRSFDRL